MKKKRAVDIMNDRSDIQVPYSVWVLWGANSKQISFHSDQACLGEDIAGLPQIREALEWYCDQFGGKVKWEK